MTIPFKTRLLRDPDRDPPAVTPVTRAINWAELSILEAKEMSAEALRIVAKSKDFCRRSDGSAS